MPDLAGYAFVGFIAAFVTMVTTPVVRRVALHFGWVVPPDDRRVHAQPTPAIGGVAMFLGLGAAMGAAWQMDRFSTLFRNNSEPLGVLLAAAVIFAVGLIDDLRPISAPAKVRPPLSSPWADPPNALSKKWLGDIIRKPASATTSTLAGSSSSACAPSIARKPAVSDGSTMRSAS